jgi:hypothetical protein
MFEANSVCYSAETSGKNSIPVTISVHAQEQWEDRMPADISLKTAWERSVDVVAPEADCTSARLYPPYSALIVVKHATVTTVLHNDGRLETPGLMECSDCDKLLDPVDHDTCPWCDADLSGQVYSGRVTLSRGDI